MIRMEEINSQLKRLLYHIRKSVGQYRVEDMEEQGRTLKATINFFGKKMKMPVVFPYGFKSYPERAWEGIAVVSEGKPEQGYIVSCLGEDKTIPSVQAGEIVLYNGKGSEIRLKADGQIELKPQNGTIKIDGNLLVAGSINMTQPADGTSAKMKVEGEIQATQLKDSSGSLEDFRDVFRKHTHIDGHGLTTQPPS